MKIVLQQMLHGYNAGHNYLRGSTYLPSVRDMETIAVLSDWTEYVNSSDDSSYLTAYPLKDCDYYVIARTWYAEEMKRPGCVWTHSILISKIDINKIVDFRIFDTLFKRPHNDDRHDYYEKALEIDPLTVSDVKTLEAFQGTLSIANILCNLVNGQQSVYDVSSSSQDYRYLCLMLMNSLPSPILLKRSFCSGTSELRYLDGELFDTQFTTAHSQRVHSLYEKEDVDGAYNYAMSYILNEDIVFSKLIHMFESDIMSSPSHYVTVCNLIKLLNSHANSKEEGEKIFFKIINLIACNYKGIDEGVLIKSKFLSKPIVSLFVDEEFFLYSVCTNDIESSISADIIDFPDRVQELAINEDTHRNYVGLISRLCSSTKLNENGLKVLSNINSYLNDEDISSIIKSDWHLYLSIINVCPEILNRGFWNDVSIGKINDVLVFFIEEKIVLTFRQWELLFRTILSNHIDIDKILAKLILSKCDNAVYILLDDLNSSVRNHDLSTLISTCGEYQNRMVEWLSRVESVEPKLMNLLSIIINPFSVEVKKRNADLWLKLSSFSNMSFDYYVFLYLLSFNWKDSLYAIEYFRTAFYPLHEALATGKLKEHQWRRIAPYTEHLPFWLNWDKCKKMRLMAVARVKFVGLYEDYLQTFTPDMNLNKELAQCW